MIIKNRSIQICGTGSGVGKSVIVAALCRIFRQDGYKVAPFKAQNMALNSFVTSEGGEIGRAQAMQAQAAKIPANVDMNPILLKPCADTRAQIILRGKPVANMNATEYTKKKRQYVKIITDSYNRLADKNDIVVIEGAGSLAEINLKKHDLVNTSMAKRSNSPVIIVADIDKGGVFASLVGTMELLDDEERGLVAGFLINKFRGDKRLLKGGLSFLEKRTGKKVFGVLPFFNPGDIRLAEEDSLPDNRTSRINYFKNKVNIDIIYLPHMSNFTDFDALDGEPGININYIRDPDMIGQPDILIIPGSKNTIGDLKFLRKNGLGKKLHELADKKREIIGICGGYQMLGRSIIDKNMVESGTKMIPGFGLLDITTEFSMNKALFQVKATDMRGGCAVEGYEIHHGRCRLINDAKPIFKITERNGKKTAVYDGASTSDGMIWGTYIHGLFDKTSFRRKFIERICARKRIKVSPKETNKEKDSFDLLADMVRKNADIGAIYRLLGIKPQGEKSTA